MDNYFNMRGIYMMGGAGPAEAARQEALDRAAFDTRVTNQKAEQQQAKIQEMIATGQIKLPDEVRTLVAQGMPVDKAVALWNTISDNERLSGLSDIIMGKGGAAPAGGEMADGAPPASNAVADLEQKAKAAALAGNSALANILMEQAKNAREEASPAPTKGREALDKQYAKDYAEYVAGGGAADTAKNIAQLEGVIRDIKNRDVSLSGPEMLAIPEFAEDIIAPQSKDAKERVQEVVQRNLRVILGAQFTEKEGEKLISRAYNSNLREEVNTRRLNALLTQMKLGAEAKASAARYFEQNGTLTGWNGKLPTLTDFESAIDGADGAKEEPDQAKEGWSIRRMD